MFHLLDVMLRTCPSQLAVAPSKAGGRGRKPSKAGRKSLQCAHPLSAHAKVWERLRGNQQSGRTAGDDDASAWSDRSRPHQT